MAKSPADSVKNNPKNNSNTKNAQPNKQDRPKPPQYLMWFRRDLRLMDNTALSAICEKAQENSASVSAVFFITPDQWQAHDQSLCQTDHILRSLPILAADLQSKLNIKLWVGICPTFEDCIASLTKLCREQNIRLVMANHEYEGNEVARDDALCQKLADLDIAFERHHDQCILPPASVCNTEGKMYQVFTPFYKKWRATLDISPITIYHPKPVHQNSGENLQLTENFIHDINEITATAEQVLSAYQKNWQKKVPHSDASAQLRQSRLDYPAGEAAAKARLADFIADDIKRYDSGRDIPSLDATSRMSAYLTLGVISARSCYLAAETALKQAEHSDTATDEPDINRWISELAWRDFYRHVLSARPDLIYHHAYKKDVDAKVNWSYDQDDFDKWCQGKTGVPLVDAAMKSLNATGFMHNRLRMVSAMFLTKDLLIDWRLGERYFMQQLIGGDFASNNGGWQWSASTGNDSAPYFRIMNPFSQGKSHDPDAIFIKTWLPELKDIPASILHSESQLNKALGKRGKFANTGYPLPMVDHKSARAFAISEFKKESSS